MLTFPVPTMPWLVAVSGGGDSMALLHGLVRAGWGPRHMVVGHVNHKWSPWGDEAEAFVRAAAARYGLDIEVAYGAGYGGTNAEAKARRERYAAFTAMVQARGLAGVMLAHTQTDSVETFLMRLGKGSGVTGLSSPLKPYAKVGELTMWRPLLGATREGLRAYLKEEGVAWLDDPSDAAGGNQRARLRAAMPQLAALGVTQEGLLGAMHSLARAEAVVEVAVDGAWEDVCLGVEPFCFDRVRLLAQPDEVGQRLMGRALATVAPGAGVPRTSTRLSFLTRVRSKPSGKETLGGCGVVWDKTCVLLTRMV